MLGHERGFLEALDGAEACCETPSIHASITLQLWSEEDATHHVFTRMRNPAMTHSQAERPPPLGGCGAVSTGLSTIASPFVA